MATLVHSFESIHLFYSSQATNVSLLHSRSSMIRYFLETVTKVVG
jgi:hypothetical protein